MEELNLEQHKAFKIVDEAMELADKGKYVLAVNRLQALNSYGAEVMDIDAVVIAGKAGNALKTFIAELIKAIGYLIDLTKDTYKMLSRYIQITLLENDEFDGYYKSLQKYSGKIRLNATEKIRFNTMFRATLALTGKFNAIDFNVNETLAGLEKAVKNMSITDDYIAVGKILSGSLVAKSMNINSIKSDILNKSNKLNSIDFNIISNGNLLPLTTYNNKLYYLGYMEKFHRNTLGLTFKKYTLKNDVDITNVNISDLTSTIKKILRIDSGYLKAVDGKIRIIEKEYLQAKRRIKAMDGYEARAVLSGIKEIAKAGDSELKLLIKNIEGIKELAKATIGG